MLVSYLPIVLFVLVAISLPVVGLTVGRLLRPFNPFREKLMPYECGVDPEGDARERYSIRYYIIAILFVVFDVETIFLFPWAVLYNKLALFGFIEMLIFILILVVGYIYVWKKGIFDWGLQARAEVRAEAKEMAKKRRHQEASQKLAA